MRSVGFLGPTQAVDEIGKWPVFCCSRLTNLLTETTCMADPMRGCGNPDLEWLMGIGVIFLAGCATATIFWLAVYFLTR